MSASLRRAPAWIVGTAAIAWRELLSLFVTPLAYVVGTLFLLLQGWNFALLLRVLNDPLAAPGPRRRTARCARFRRCDFPSRRAC